LKKVKHSYSDVSNLEEFFDKTQNFQKTFSFTDINRASRSNARATVI